MFPGVAKLGNICFGRKICVREAKMFLTLVKNIFCFRAAKFFCFRAAKFVSATYAFGAILFTKSAKRRREIFIFEVLTAAENLPFFPFT